MVAVNAAQSTYAQIEELVRELTASPNEASLSSSKIAQSVNTFYSQDFPYAIKIDQMRSVYTFYTAPNIDRYPVNIIYNQGFRNPVYFEGVQGNFFKDRAQFFGIWPKWPTRFQPATGDGVTTSFSFTIGGTPFLRKEVVVGTINVGGSAIQIADDGNGNLYYQSPNTPVSNPLITSVKPGMKNVNYSAVNGTTEVYPGDNIQTLVGTVNYTTGAFVIDFSLASVIPNNGSEITVWVSQYATSRPYSLLFWNNELTVRPVPDNVYKVEVESYLTPVQFLDSTDNPIVNQWWQYIAYGAAMEILRHRQDMDGVANLLEGFKRQEGLVLERQAIEEIGQQNSTIYNSRYQQGNWNNGIGWYS